jgi:hypothetical protein
VKRRKVDFHSLQRGNRQTHRTGQSDAGGAFRADVAALLQGGVLCGLLGQRGGQWRVHTRLRPCGGAALQG